MRKRLQRKPVLAILLSAFMTFSMAGFIALFAHYDAKAEDSLTWDGDLVAAGWGEDGDKELPDGYREVTDGDDIIGIEISSAAALAYFAHEVYADTEHLLDGITVDLLDNVDLGNYTWIPIGTTQSGDAPEIRFTGTFNGHGNKIYNLGTGDLFDKIHYSEGKFDNTDYYYEYVRERDERKAEIPFGVNGNEYSYGLFGVATDVTINNLTIEGVQIGVKDVTPVGGGSTLVPGNVGTFIGYGTGTVTFVNCQAGSTTEDAIVSTSENDCSYGGFVGGLYAYGNGTTNQEDYKGISIKNGKNYVDINCSGAESKLGGFVGFATHTNGIEFKNCVNNGNILGGHYAAGIAGYLIANGNSQPSEDGYLGSYLFTDCDNYGKIGSQTTKQAGGISNSYIQQSESTNKISGCNNYGSVLGCEYVGGIIGYYNVNATGSELVNNFNYGNIYSYSASGAGGYLGYSSLDSEGKVSGGNLGTVYGTATDIGCVYGVKHENLNEDYMINAGSVEEEMQEPSGSLNYNHIRYTEEEYISDNGTFKYYNNPGIAKIILGFADNTIFAGGTITIPAGYDVGYAAFVDHEEITAIEFEGNIAKIEDFAFAGTSIKNLTLPASLTSIGAGAFADCANLNNVVLPSTAANMTLGIAVFSGTRLVEETLEGTYLIATGNDQYRQLLLNGNFTNRGAILTHEVVINYMYDDNKLGAETRLHGQDYGVVQEGVDWVYKAPQRVGPAPSASAQEYVWYDSIDRTNVISQPENVTGLLSSVNADTITLYAYSTSNDKVFIARTGIVYDKDKTYTMSDLNALLYSTSSLITSSMTAEIIEYTPDGNSTPDFRSPTVVHNAGTYVIRVTEGAKIYKFKVIIERATLDLASLSNLQWYIAKIGSENTNASLLEEKVLYVYTYGNQAAADKRGKEYPSLKILDDAQVSNLKLNSSYEVRTVSYSALRNRGKEVTLSLQGDGFTATYSGNTGTDVGMYQAEALLTATVNYRFTVVDTISKLRGLDIKITNEGKSATITKKWYIVDLSNWLVASGSEEEYTVADHTFGTAPAFGAPDSYYKSETGLDGEIRLYLYIWNTAVNSYVSVGGEEGFLKDRFDYYINEVMPAGSYRLEIRVSGVTTSDEEDNESVYRTGFSETFTFTVAKASLADNGLVNAVIEALSNETTFTSNIAGGVIYDETTQSVVDALLNAGAISRGTTVWAGTEYDSYYGKFTLKYNLARWYNDEYRALEDKDTSTPDTYKVYYKISAPNYYDNTEEGSRFNYFFNLVKYEVLQVFDTSNINITYTGNRVLPTVEESDKYEVLWTDSEYISGGTHTISFRLYDPEHYYWEVRSGVLLTDNGATATVSYTVAKAENSFTVSLNMLGWSYETRSEANNIRAIIKFGSVSDIHFSIIKDGETTAVSGLGDFAINADGEVNEEIGKLLDKLPAGSYALHATVAGTDNYSGISDQVPFVVTKTMNYWASSDEDLVLPSWIVGKYNAEANPIVVNAEHGEVKIKITDIDGNEYYNSEKGLNNLNDCKAGKYLLVAWVDETENFAGLAERTFTIQVFERAGLAWWAIMLIIVGSLAAVALVIFILWKRGVFQIVTEKFIVAIRTRASVEATMASIRAAKMMEEGRQSVADAKRRERIEKLRQQSLQESELSPEELAAKYEARAKEAEARAEKLRKRSEEAQKMAEKKSGEGASSDDTPETPTEE